MNDSRGRAVWQRSCPPPSSEVCLVCGVWCMGPTSAWHPARHAPSLFPRARKLHHPPALSSSQPNPAVVAAPCVLYTCCGSHKQAPGPAHKHCRPATGINCSQPPNIHPLSHNTHHNNIHPSPSPWSFLGEQIITRHQRQTSGQHHQSAGQRSHSADIPFSSTPLRVFRMSL